MQVRAQEQASYEALREEFGYTNRMQAPRIERVVISTGVGRVRHDKHKMEVIEDRLARITGQRPAPAQARKSIAQFKVRAGDVSALRVTLSGERAYDMLDKIIHVALPRTKDFRGIKREAVDEMGNLTIGVREHTIFPETGDEDIRDVFGLAVTVVSSAHSAQEGRAFFEHIGVPFRSET